MSIWLGLGLGAAGSLAGHLFAGRQAQKGRKEYHGGMDRLLEGYRADLAPYLADTHRDYFQSDEIQSVLNALREQLKKRGQAVTGNVARTGGTSEQKIAMLGAPEMAGAMTELAGHAGAMRRGARDSYMAHRGGLRGMESQMLHNMLQDRFGRADMWRQWADNMMTGGVSLANYMA